MLQERQALRKEGFFPLFIKLLHCHFPEAGRERGRESGATDSAGEEVSHGNCGLDRERSLLFPASSAGERVGACWREKPAEK